MMNPMQLIQMLQQSGNPMQMLTGMAQTNPQLGQVMQMVNGKTPAEIERMAYDIAKQRGIDLNLFVKQMGIRLPK